MPISGVANYYGYNPDYVSDKAGGTLDKDDFLKLIIAQLSHQDPLSPVQSSEFMTQMASMGTLEQMQNLNANFKELMTSQSLVYASQLIGQTVQAIDQTSRTIIEGIVGNVSVQDSEVMVQVGTSTVALKDIINIYPWTSSQGLMQASQMIGMNVTAIDPNDALGLKTISGTVNEVGVSMYGDILLKFKDETSGYTYSVGLGDVISISKTTSPESE